MNYPHLSLFVKRVTHSQSQEQCGELLVYALSRLDHCRFGDSKPTCKNCPIHCYKPSMREHMRRVMRYAGPRMLWYHPLTAIRHLSDDLFGACRRD